MELNTFALPERLIPWFAENMRELPWRRDREPYHVWLSEIMLQQTRVEAVKDYYARFLESCPDIASLAACDDDRLRKLWEGLGYYSRVRNLKKAAQVIMREYQGVFPQTFDAVHALPGIGDYTAGAICSICFGLPTPAVDGNVLRVISRITASLEPVTDPKVKAAIRDALAEVYPSDSCGTFTQALMELGAIVCAPNGEPHCEKCPLAEVCRCRESGLWKEIPVKAAKKERRKEKRTVFILRCGDRLVLDRRGSSGLLADLWEFPNITDDLPLQQALGYCAANGFGTVTPVYETEKKHIFTHIEWEMHGYFLNCTSVPAGYTLADLSEIEADYSLPTAFRQFLDALPAGWRE